MLDRIPNMEHEMKKAHQFAGRRFGRLLVLEKRPTDGGGTLWLCRCDCGREKDVRGIQLAGGKTQSCGCLRRELHSAGLSKRRRTHGLSRHPMYPVWRNMMARCYDPASDAFPDYGARGVTVCERWHDVGNYIADIHDTIGVRPFRGATVDRINNERGYEPGNVRWANRYTQNSNRRTVRWIEFNGETRTLAQWARLTGINEGAIRNRLDVLGWSIERALTTPISDDHHRRGRAAAK